MKNSILIIKLIWNVFLILRYNNDLKLQKNRFALKIRPLNKLKLKFGDYGIFVLNTGRLEFVQLNFIKKTIKKIMKYSKHSEEIPKKIWYNIVSNHIIQFKSKNSRMGKGKGLFDRRVIRIAKNTILFEFTGVSVIKLNFFVKKINKKLNVKTYVLNKGNNLYKTFNNKNIISTYFIKFLKTV